METETNTDTLAALILRRMDRLDEGGDHAIHSSRGYAIEGMKDAWEHLTGETATEEALKAAAERVR